MTVTKELAGRRFAWRAATGWTLCALIGVLLMVNGGWLMLNLTAPELFEAETGVVLSELRAQHPTVVQRMEIQANVVGLSIVGIGLMLSVLAVAGLRTGQRSVWIGSAAGALAVAAIAVAVLAEGAAVVATAWVGYAVLLAVGLFLAWARAGRE